MNRISYLRIYKAFFVLVFSFILSATFPPPASAGLPDLYLSNIEMTKDSAQAVNDVRADSEGLEFLVVVVSGDEEALDDHASIYAASSRTLETDVFFFQDAGDVWIQTGPDGEIPLKAVAANSLTGVQGSLSRTLSFTIKIVSTIPGRPYFALGLHPGCASAFVMERDFPAGCDISHILQQTAFGGPPLGESEGKEKEEEKEEGGATNAGAEKGSTQETLRFPESGVETGADAVPDWGWLADGKTAYSMPVRVTAGGIGVSGIEVLFTMSEGEGAVLSAPSAVTDKNGIAQVFITASKPGAYVLDAVISDKHRDREDLLVSFIRKDKPILQFTAGSAYYTVDGVAQSAVAPAFVRDGRAYLSVRDMGKALGATIEWDQDSQAATLTNSAAVVRIPVGATTIYANQRGARSDIAVDAPAVNEKGRVYLPFRAVLELFGYQVSYDQEKQEITCI